MKTEKEIEATIPSYIEAACEGVFDGTRYFNFNIEDAKKAVYWNYKKAGYDMPVVKAFENPLEAEKWFNQAARDKKQIFEIYSEYRKLNGKPVDKTVDQMECNDTDMTCQYVFTLNVSSDCYHQWYNFIKNEFDVQLDIASEFEECFALQKKSGVYSAIFAEFICCVVKYPKKIHIDANRLPHCTTGSAFEWGYEKYPVEHFYIHGRRLTKEDYNKCLSPDFSAQDWMKEKNADIKAAWFEILGASKVMEILGGEEIDRTTKTHNVILFDEKGLESGVREETEEFILYKTPFSLEEIGEPLAWVRFACPSTGSNYLINVNPVHDNVKDAVLDTCPFEVSWDEYQFTQRG